MQKLLKINFLDIKNTVQDELIETLKTPLKSRWEIEIEQSKEKTVWINAPKSWQEAYVRLYAIDYDIWGSLDETSEAFQKVDWLTLLEEHAYSVATTALEEGFKNLVLEVKL